MSKSTSKRVEYLEEIVIGAGFLLQKLLINHEADLSVGMTEQIRQCIRDCREVGRVHTQRKTTGA